MIWHKSHTIRIFITSLLILYRSTSNNVRVMGKRSSWDGLGKVASNTGRSIVHYLKQPCRFLKVDEDGFRDCTLDNSLSCPPQGSLTFKCPIDSFEPKQ